MLLINAKADYMNYCEPENGFTALICASRNGHTEIVKMLLAAMRGNVNKQDKVSAGSMFF